MSPSHLSFPPTTLPTPLMLPRLVKKWKTLSNGRPFLLKGIQHPDDARKAMEAGCDGVVCSNHAGRQVDGAVGSLDMLPEVSHLTQIPVEVTKANERG